MGQAAVATTSCRTVNSKPSSRAIAVIMFERSKWHEVSITTPAGRTPRGRMRPITTSPSVAEHGAEISSRGSDAV